ncbi:BCL2/adenovirus E1B 19 kDa protein-interacting protein 2 isoform X3 [Vanessa atalanta]|uniref:BCL2/adenovirus E1B 19 kDa protein-interacting protein 2 isoform X3 n=1 Tax=Vanessa atalanta TaxID=42275 RepID=UPI001FCCECD1|nr:BCL2/adenovirus E1B 19 kDa protein-interacting protein 2 isoform X3 [Vanessa atalanta]
MNSLQSSRLSEDDLYSSPSSDEKMDTASESLRSTQDTPNSILSDSEERETEVLRLQNPNVLRLLEPEKLDNKLPLKPELNDSLVTRMSNLRIESPIRPKNLGISPPRLSSTLTLTTSHPLMTLSSPDENFPDVVPKKVPKIDEDKDLSLSSIEDERGPTNGYELYTPLRNTSKNNLYFSDNFVTADSHMLSESLNVPPDVARVEQKERRKIIPRFTETPTTDSSTPHKNMCRLSDGDKDCAIKYNEERHKLSSHSTPKAMGVDVSESEEFHSDLDSPDVISSSTQEDRSAYQALLDPYTGSVALRHTAPKSNPPRRKVQLPPEDEDDRCSLDSISGCSMDSEDEPPPPAQQPDTSEEDNTKRSKSTNTVSECSDPIPEYSAAEEFRDERSWLTVQHSGGRAICDMKVIEPFKRVVSHGGYEAGGAALIVFSACHLPDSARPDYRYVMDNLFLYVMWSLERLVTDEYVLVYLHGSAGRRRMPTFAWLHECYKLLDRRLRKSLKHLYLVHPTFWLKSFVIVTKPFVSSKFFRKLTYVKSLQELLEKVPVEPNAIPEIVKQYDANRR